MTPKRNDPQRLAASPHIVTRFEVGQHVVEVSKMLEGRWVAAVDEEALQASFATQADAWEAGVREADRRDRTPPQAKP